MAFVTSLHPDWNISIFHYRNHGADVGRIVVGVQVAPAELEAWQGFLDGLDYAYVNETDNPAYRLFLGELEEPLQALVAGTAAVG